MKEEKDKFEDEKLRGLMSDSKLTASENLQFRIMHQIEAELALRPKKVRSARPLIGNVLGVAIVLYILVVLVGVGAYMAGGIDALTSANVILPVLAMTSAAAFYCLIITLDERRYRK